VTTRIEEESQTFENDGVALSLIAKIHGRNIHKDLRTYSLGRQRAESDGEVVLNDS
jgi:hypothetical protein